MKSKKLDPIHPGKILSEEFLSPLAISQSKLARDIGVPHQRINEIVNEKRSMNPDTCIRLSMYFGTSPEFWINLQLTYELRLLQKEKENQYSRIPHYSKIGLVQTLPKLPNQLLV